MSIIAPVPTSGGGEVLAFHANRPATRAFVPGLIEAAWGAARDAVVRNALAECGRYVGLELPRQPAPPAPRLTNILVLGADPLREEFFGRRLRLPVSGLLGDLVFRGVTA